MYRGKDVCLSHVGDFRGECISRTANTDGPHLFYFRKKKKKNTPLKEQCVAVLYKCKMHGVSASEPIVCAANHLPRESIMCATAAAREERRRKALFLNFFFICFRCIIMTMPRASRRPPRRQLVVSLERDVPRCHAVLCLDEHKPPSLVVVCQPVLRGRRSYRLRDI